MRILGYMMSDDGHPMLFVRPKDPELAMQLAEELVGKSGPEIDERFQEIVRRQEYTFVGYVAKVERFHFARRKRVIEFWVADENGEIVGKPARGDSMISSPEYRFPTGFPCEAAPRVEVHAEGAD